ncbi:hypothetical protein ElyMa_004556700 [Elysia marginata]|uniref:Uncharacterized protein n=1 Tax=Elysia marginata TaxID=1093978 RepID=A0AAV4HSE8_9GAST|nr:hypothetical protein ElyMa_004556700 [Elysia marginata]
MEGERHRSPQHKEISITAESPPDVGRLIVPPEDLDRVDGIRPSSSRTRAVALLPAIEESLEEGPESLSLGAKSKHGGQRTSSKPMLSSISEERIPRLWEYPVGGRSWERGRSSGHALGAGEAPTLQSECDQSSPLTFDKTTEGDAALVEAGDAEAREGNRSNHALEGPNSGPEEKNEVSEVQNISLTATSTAESGGKVGDSKLENMDGTGAAEDIISSNTGDVGSNSHIDSEQLNTEANAASLSCSQVIFGRSSDATNLMLPHQELNKLDRTEKLPFLVDGMNENFLSKDEALTEYEGAESFELSEHVELSDLSVKCVNSERELNLSEDCAPKINATLSKEFPNEVSGNEEPSEQVESLLLPEVYSEISKTNLDNEVQIVLSKNDLYQDGRSAKESVCNVQSGVNPYEQVTGDESSGCQLDENQVMTELIVKEVFQRTKLSYCLRFQA